MKTIAYGKLNRLYLKRVLNLDVLMFLLKKEACVGQYFSFSCCFQVVTYTTNTITTKIVKLKRPRVC